MDFNTQALTWDNEKRTKRAKVIAEQIAQVVPLKRHYSALEFGCGTGLISFNLFDKLKDITCIDTSQGMIDVLNSKIKSFQVNNMVAYQYDINNESSLVQSFDVIFTSMALHHIVDCETTLAKLYQVLKKDGYLCIVELDEDDGSFHKAEKDFNGHNGFSQKELKMSLDKIGLEELESHTFLKDEKMIDEVRVDYSLFIMKGKKLKE